MRIRWYGQSAFTLTGDEHTVTIDPFGVPQPGLPVRFAYPAIAEHPADLLLITHEHFDHNGAEVVAGSPEVVRSTAGVFPTKLGDVTAIASEHDPSAGTQRGPNTIFVFELDGRRVCHFGDFGQPALRPEQRAAIGAVDLLMVPVGGGPTLDAEQAVKVVGELEPRWVVPMHYRTEAIDFLEPADAFIGRFDRVVHAPEPEHDLATWDADGTTVLHLAAPVA
jgi:L-ascorbate metabolism protein UlaG (beta-lactamase superfamily)